MSKTNFSISTNSWLVSAGRQEDNKGLPLNVPPILASNFILGGHYEYSRNEGTESWKALEEIVGGLEKGLSLLFSSGMAAIAAVFDQVEVGSTIVIPDDCYQGVSGLAVQGEQKGIWKVERIPLSETELWLKALDYASLVWLESPSNPMLEIADLQTICGTSRRDESLLVVDNTFATHLNQQPLTLGADVSIQSATKFIGGHSDLLSGITTVKDEELFNKLLKTRSLSGATPGALEVFLAIRGIRTMHLRLERAQQNAMEIATRLLSHSGVEKVRYPGLESHPQHLLAKEQLAGFGTIISFDLVGNSQTADKVCEELNLIQHATSLGAVESTIERRAAIQGQEHLPETLLRLSVGVEDVEDLWHDLDMAIRML